MSDPGTAVVEAPQTPAPMRRTIEPSHDDGFLAALLDTARFDQIQRAAKVFSESTLVPEHYRGKASNCVIAVALAHQMQLNPLMFMLKTYPVGGKIGMEAQLSIALANTRGPFTGPIQYDITGTGDDRGCVAWAIHRDTGKRVESPRVTVKTAKDEGWHARNPKWQKAGATQDLMLHYRAGAWLARLFCPEALLGMSTLEEMEDLGDVTISGENYRVETTPLPTTRRRAAVRPPVIAEASEGATAPEPKNGNGGEDAEAAPEVTPESEIPPVTPAEIEALCREALLASGEIKEKSGAEIVHVTIRKTLDGLTKRHGPAGATWESLGADDSAAARETRDAIVTALRAQIRAGAARAEAA